MTAVTLLAVHPLATTNAVLNSIAAVLLVIGWVAIARGRWRAHRVAMIAAFAVSTVFLFSYLTYHAIAGSVPFRGQGIVRPIYFTILVSHVILAAAVPFLALRMFFLAWRGRWEAHRRLGRITLPVWLYVSVTGVVIYLMLYHLPGMEGVIMNFEAIREEVGMRQRPFRPARGLTSAIAMLAVVVVALTGGEAVGCPNCKDAVSTTDPDGLNIARGYFYSILLMLAMPFTLAGSFGCYVWREMRRQQREQVRLGGGLTDGSTSSAMPGPGHGHRSSIGSHS